ncbi:MAG TPA: decaprenyl-phosphate phosphoribosyltransferase [Candidatus Pacebacteria bacterium]|nr:decaprenyl-phosphate phosphoribosyltransferase [Candidatus Paceibacterota bacterium]
MNSIPFLLLKSFRPKQWLKNLAIYAALIFSGFLFHQEAGQTPYFITVTYAFFIFCFLTSSIYLINDLFDIESDRKHPFKKNRPLASGKLPIPIAVFSVVTGLAIVFLLSLSLPSFFKILIFAYLLLQILYSSKLKQYAIFDIISIALSFLIRVYAGAVVVNLHMNVWFLLTVVSASLFLAVGKRQSERTLLGEQHLGPSRQTLKKYSQRLLDQYTGMFANATWLSYALFAFQHTLIQNTPANERFPGLYVILPRTLQSEKLLMLTLPFVIFGVMRYLQLVYEENRGESPELILLKDRPLLTTVFSWGILVMLVIYA